MNRAERMAYKAGLVRGAVIEQHRLLKRAKHFRSCINQELSHRVKETLTTQCLTGGLLVLNELIKELEAKK